MTLDSSVPARQRKIRAASNTSELWQAHARRSFEAACRSGHGEVDAVRLFKTRRAHPLRELARRSNLALALCHASESRATRPRLPR